MIKIKFKDNIYIKETKSYIKISELLNELSFPMPCNGKGKCLKCKVEALGDLSPLSPIEKENLKEDEIKSHIRLACMTYIKSGEITVSSSFLNLENKDYKGKNLGVAVDIGTSFIVCNLLDTLNKNITDSVRIKNPLVSFGADVISKIEYAINNDFSKMTNILRESIFNIINSLTREDLKIVVTGNTTMVSIFAGIDIKPFGEYPFKVLENFGKEFIINNKKIYIPYCPSAFVGSDITAGILNCEKNKNYLFIDIGTNSEIILKKDDIYYSTSTSAGSAFEGESINFGMYGEKGAISKVIAYNNTLRMTTILNEKPKGICGSGIIDILSILKKYKVVSETGEISEENHPFINNIYDNKFYLTNDIYITSEDITNIILAKGAIRAGIECLIKFSGIDIKDIDIFYIGGAFGNYLNIENAVEIGLFPKEFLNKTKVLGNTSIKGAEKILFDNIKEQREFINLELANYEDFTEIFTRNMEL